MGPRTLATTVGTLLPDESMYPFGSVPNFEAMSSQLILASQCRDMGFAPIAVPEQVENLEAMLQDYYAIRFPNPSAGYHEDYGFGIWNDDPITGKRYHDTTGRL